MRDAAPPRPPRPGPGASSPGRGAPTPPAFAPPVRRPAFHVVAGVLTLALGTAATLLARRAWASEPARGYTTLGLWLASVGSALFLAVLLYSWRKRWGQEVLPGRLQTWLRLHLWLSALGTWAVLLHAGFHVDDRWGTVALGALAFVLLTGLVGWWLYVLVPPAVDRHVGNLAVPHTSAELARIEATLTRFEAGASDAFRAQLQALRRGAPAPKGLGRLGADEAERLEEARGLVARLATEHARRARQVRYKRWLRLWLWLHVPAACALPFVVAYHALDALEVRTEGRPRAPEDFADPLSCARCHPQQVEEWLGSMHSMAMSSPTVDLQHRLLVAVDRRREAEKRGHAGLTQGPVAGDLCVRCHAPTGHHPGLTDAPEPLLARATQRAPASAYGISCVACHHITDVAAHASGGRLAHPLEEIEYRNIDNLSFAPGRTMSGAFGGPGGAGGGEAVGNGGHKSAPAPAFLGAGASVHGGSSAFCASCHTVVVDRPDAALSHGTGEPVLLQNSYREWLEGGTAADALHWAAEGVGCLDCHARDLGGVVAAVKRMADRRQTGYLPLAQRRAAIVALVRANAVGLLPGEDALAALPADGFDRPLPARRRYRHSFTGVDLPLDDQGPLLPGARGLGEDERRRANRALRDAMGGRIDDLLSIAAAVEIDDVVRGAKGRVKGRVLNLATGHHLPAGFAFAREMWLEVTRIRGGREHVLLGGDGAGAPLPPTYDLVTAEKQRKDFVNLQAVLWNGTAAPAGGAYNADGETVIQIEVPEVLAGAKAQKAGFPDRKGPLLPGHTLAFDVDAGALEAGDTVRVRLLFRGFPPKFLVELRRRLAHEHPALADDPAAVEADLRRLDGLASGLVIREMARDER